MVWSEKAPEVREREDTGHTGKEYQGPALSLSWLIHARRWWDRRGWFRAVATILTVILQASPASAGALERAILGKSAIVDLSHSEGERQAPLPSGSVGKDFGTWLNALGIVRKDKRTIAQIPLRELLAPAVVVNMTAKVAEAPEYRATVEDLLAWERQYGRIPKRSVVLLYTGWAGRSGRCRAVRQPGCAKHVPRP